MKKITGVALVTALIMTGCGGGTSSSTPSSSFTSVSGNAVKGIVKNANVLVCKVINGVAQADASCATTTTGTDGSYSIAFSDGYTGPVLVKIQPTTSGTPSTMLDETTGADIPYTLTMRAVASAVSTNTTVYVTPFSEMAAASAVATTMNAKTISQSITAVQNLTGVDLSVMPIINLKSNSADPATLTAQANTVTQLGNLVMAAKTASSITDANGVACNVTSSSTSQQIACAVSALADPTKSAGILATMSSQKLTSVSMPILQANGTIVQSTIDMTSASSVQSTMQSALQGAGMAAVLQSIGAVSGVTSAQNIASAVASTATMMSGGMKKK